MHRDTLRFLGLAGGKVLVAGVGLAMSVFVGRLLGPEGLGEWALLIAGAALLHTGLISWSNGSIVRFGCEEWVTHGTLRGTVSGRLPLVLASAAVAAALLVLQPFDWLARGFGLVPDAWRLIALYLVSLWITAEAQAVLQATDRIGLQAVLGPIAAALSVVFVAFAAALGARDVGSLLLALSLAAIAVWGTAWVATLKQAGARWQPPRRREVRRQLVYGAPLLLGFGVDYVITWGDHLLLRQLASLEAVGQFGLAYQTFLLLISGAGLLTTLLLPRLITSELHAPGASRAYLERAAPTVLVLWAICSLFAVAVVPPVVAKIAGAPFQSAALPLAILCILVPAHAVTSLYSVLFNLQERLGRLTLYGLGMATLNVSLSIALIPRFGPEGAAAATVAAYVFAQAMQIRDQHRKLKVPTTRVVPVWIAALAVGAVQVVMPTQLQWRLLWGGAAVWLVCLMARRTSAVDARLVEQLFVGILAPVGGLLRRALVVRGREIATASTLRGHHARTV